MPRGHRAILPHMKALVWLSCLVLAACGDGAADSADAAATPPAIDAAPGQPPDAAAPGSHWQPAPGTSWQWQLSGTIDTSVDVTMYDIDLFDTPQTTIDALRGDGRVVICYFSAGSREDWRPDAGDIPTGAVGEPLDGWPGEAWLDVRDSGVRAVMAARLDLAVAKRCDGVEPDNVDGYANDSGFPLTGDDQLAFNRYLATEAHARGLSIGLKNDLDQVPALLPDFDWALNEECFAYDECDALAPFVAAGKAVFNVEYGDQALADSICPDANARDFDTLVKDLELGPERIACR